MEFNIEIFQDIMYSRMILPDDDFGNIMIFPNARARNISMRVKPDGVHVTVPVGANLKQVMGVVESYRPRLLESFRKRTRRVIGDGFSIGSSLFRITVRRGKTMFLSLKCEADGGMVLLCPDDYDMESEKVQSVLERALLQTLKTSAAGILPRMVGELAASHGMKYSSVKVSTAKSRWGSCSSRGVISLSCYLLLLPEHLVRYVILHELAHTREMNHGPRFWALLDDMTGGRAHELRKEISGFSPGIL